MAPLAAYLSALRQEWPLAGIQTVLGECAHLPYAQVALGAVRAATDPAVTHARGIRKAVTEEGRRGSPPPPPRVCPQCRRTHDPGRPEEHVRVPEPESVRRGAALVRAALKGQPPPPEPPRSQEAAQLPLEDAASRDHMQRAAGER